MIDYLQEERAKAELEPCTFQPDTKKSKRPEELMEPKRDLYDFLSDQQRFLEYKNMKEIKTKQDDLNDELREIKKPKIDNLSNQIVDLMEDRKQKPTKDRLYQMGQEKLRAKAFKEYQDQKAAEEHASIKKSPRRADEYSPDKSYRRGKPTRTALYDMHHEKIRDKEQTKQQILYEESIRNNTQFKNKESEELRINGFKKEFRQKLAEIQRRRKAID